MSWIRLEDNFPEHPKILAVSTDARWVYVVGLCYASKYLTDGFVPSILVSRSRRPVAELIEAGLWDVDGDGLGYLIHDYLTYQQSREQVEQRRKVRAEAGRAGARKRWQRP